MFEELTYQVVALVELAPLWLVYLVFFSIAYLENVIPPVPGDVLVAFAGYLAADGLLRIDLTLAGTTIASVAGFMTMYVLGARVGEGINQERDRYWIFRFIGFEYMERARRWMRRTGPAIILANRFLAGTRSVISLMAGVSHVPVRLAITYSLVSSILWNGLLLAGGWMVRENWEEIGGYLNTYGGLVLLGIAAFATWRYVRHWRTLGVDIGAKDH